MSNKDLIEKLNWLVKCEQYVNVGDWKKYMKESIDAIEALQAKVDELAALVELADSLLSGELCE
jgi:hypothetical protein